MPHRTLSRAMRVTIAGVVLLSLLPATAGAIGSTTTVKPVSRTAVSEAPRDGEGGEGREARDMSTAYFLSGMLCGVPLGLMLGHRLLRRWQSRKEKQRDMDRLTAQFQALFRAIYQGKK
jgi:hypothetical protein